MQMLGVEPFDLLPITRWIAEGGHNVESVPIGTHARTRQLVVAGGAHLSPKVCSGTCKNSGASREPAKPNTPLARPFQVFVRSLVTSVVFRPPNSDSSVGG